ncbi:hypothetical protein MED01_002485 [Micromonospora sp. MED01]|uniref:hypothetical protein n=1 Tax=Micromonospora alfalfae TaxID=2911212 RepID=UPI001EE7C4EF|nr:hypothetical protein [Micromonospora alfalfae]MCG5464319.1 hypothetical protein [Micromonospora alfalfae]
MPPEHTILDTAKPGTRTDAVVALSFDTRLTAAQLASLSPDQITRLFQAVHTVANLTEVAQKNAADSSSRTNGSTA